MVLGEGWTSPSYGRVEGRRYRWRAMAAQFANDWPRRRRSSSRRKDPTDPSGGADPEAVGIVELVGVGTSDFLDRRPTVVRISPSVSSA